MERGEEPRAARDVVLEVALRDLHRLAGRLVGGEVHDRIDLVLVDHACDERGVGDVTHFEWRVEHRFAVAVLQGIEHDHVGARVAQGAHRVRADVAGTSRHQDAHMSASSS